MGSGIAGELILAAQPGPQFGRRGEGFNRALDARDEVEFDDFLAVGGVGELEAEDFGVVLGLLQTIGGFLVFRLGLGDGDGKIAGVTQEVVGALAFFAVGLGAAHDDAPVGEAALLGNGVRVRVPASRL